MLLLKAPGKIPLSDLHTASDESAENLSSSSFSSRPGRDTEAEQDPELNTREGQIQGLLQCPSSQVKLQMRGRRGRPVFHRLPPSERARSR